MSRWRSHTAFLSYPLPCPGYPPQPRAEDAGWLGVSVGAFRGEPVFLVDPSLSGGHTGARPSNMRSWQTAGVAGTAERSRGLCGPQGRFSPSPPPTSTGPRASPAEGPTVDTRCSHGLTQGCALLVPARRRGRTVLDSAFASQEGGHAELRVVGIRHGSGWKGLEGNGTPRGAEHLSQSNRGWGG